MKNKKLQRLLDSIKECNNTALAFGSGVISYLIIVDGINSWQATAAAVICFFSLLIGVFILLVIVGAWNTKNRKEWMSRMYFFFSIQLMLLFLSVIFVGMDLKLV